MKQLLAIAFITLLALGMGCAWISPSSQAASDGIQVHGHWTMTVSNPDGTVDAVHEFDNALVTQGKESLVRLLGGENTIAPNTLYPAGWGLFVQPVQNVLECDEGSYSSGFTMLKPESITDINGGLSSLSLVATCTASLMHDGTSDFNEVTTIELNRVYSMIFLSNITNPLYFSEHSFNPYINIQKNQRISFTVRFTFE